MVSDALRKKWRQKVGPRYPGAVFTTLARLKARFANRMAVEVIGDLNAMKQRWLQPLTKAKAPERPAKPTYGLFYNETTKAILVAWPNDKRRTPRRLLLAAKDRQDYCSQGYRVFMAILNHKDEGIVTDAHLASELYQRHQQPYSLKTPT